MDIVKYGYILFIKQRIVLIDMNFMTSQAFL